MLRRAFLAIGLSRGALLVSLLAVSALCTPATASATVSNVTYHADGTANDVSGNHDGTWVGTARYAPGFTGRPGDQAFSFNGDGSYIRTDLTVGSLGTAPSTISFDFRSSSSPATDESIMGARSSCDSVASGEGWWDVRIVPGGNLFVEFGVVPTSYVPLFGSHDIADGLWHEVVIHRDYSGITVYVDGQLDAEGPPVAGNIDPSVPFSIDNDPCIGVDGTQPLVGNIDEVNVKYVSSTNNGHH